MMEDLDFKSFFNEKVRARGLTLKKLSDLSGIAIHHLEHLAHGQYHKLPAAPYLRGYLRNLGRVLDFEPNVWLEYFDEIDALKSSGKRDELPANRFTVQAGKKYAWAILAAIVLLGYFGFRYSKIFGQPVLTLMNPAEVAAQTDRDVFTVRGTVREADELFVNNETVLIAPDGSWQKELALQPGVNIVIVRAKKFLGRETTVERQIVYEPPPPPDAVLDEEPSVE